VVRLGTGGPDLDKPARQLPHDRGRHLGLPGVMNAHEQDTRPGRHL